MATSKKRKPAAKRPQLSKMDLLPVPATKARDVSLRSHVALENLRNGYLDIEQAADLTKTLYVCYFLSGDQLTEEGLGTMVLAEAGLKRVIDLAVHSDTGRLEPDECQAIGAVLDEHDYLLIRTARIVPKLLGGTWSRLKEKRGNHPIGRIAPYGSKEGHWGVKPATLNR